MSAGKELCLAVLVLGSVWAALSALAVAVSIDAGERGPAWGWAASFAASALCAAYCFGRLL